MTEREMVEAFHRAFGIPVRERPEMPDEAERHLRCTLLVEEVTEFIATCGMRVWQDSAGVLRVTVDRSKTPDLAAMAHENADIRVITLGTDLTMGAPAEVFAEIMRANMRKLGPDGRTVRRADGKVVKPPGFVPADVASVLRQFTQSNPKEKP